MFHQRHVSSTRGNFVITLETCEKRIKSPLYNEQSYQCAIFNNRNEILVIAQNR